MNDTMHISWTLDTNDDGMDPVDPLGDVELTGDDGSKTIERCTNVDFFFLALVQVVRSLRLSGIASVELAVEPSVLTAALIDGGFILTHGARKLRFNSLADFTRELASQIRALLDVLGPAARAAGVLPSAHPALEAFAQTEFAPVPARESPPRD